MRRSVHLGVGVCLLCYTEFFGLPLGKESPTKMKAGIHPAYEEVNVICACGHVFRTRSAHKGDIRVEICSQCHPFFTGRQKLMDTEGRVERFNKRYQKTKAAQEKRKAPTPA